MLNIIKSALSVSSHKLNVVSNNIANTGSTGFKRSEAAFRDVYLASAGASGPNVGQGSMVAVNRVSHNPAELKQTGVSMDMAVNGHGMFMLGSIEGTDQVTFTRNGSFQINETGLLSANDGSPVLTRNLNQISVPFQNNGIPLSGLEINPEGDVLATYGVAMPLNLGRIGLANFDNPAALRQLGNGRYLATEEASLFGAFDPKNGGVGSVISGHLEVSNVDLTNELVGLINAQQAFTAASKALQADSDMVSRFTR